MVAVSMDEARSELRLIEDRLEECVRKAWSEFRSVQAMLHPGMRVRARRTLMQDLVVKQIEEAFGDIPGFRIIEGKSGRVLLVVADRLVLQFRHVDKEFKTANFPTKMARDFDAQRHVVGLPPLPRITVGYRLDRLETAVEGVYVIFSIGKSRVWHYRLNDGEPAFGTETLELFPNGPAPAPAADEPRRRVRPKRPTERDEVVPIHNETQ
jgi:hypothetical protein